MVSAPDAEGLSAQRFFCDHAHEISTVAVHPDGVTVATGEDAVSPHLEMGIIPELAASNPQPYTLKCEASTLE